MNPILDIRKLTRQHGTGDQAVHALRGIDLSVAAGELVAVMGPSGSGKSTLLTCAGGLDQPTSGEILIDGNDITTLSRNAVAALRRRRIGYVFQDFNLIPALTAVENVALPLELDGARPVPPASTPKPRCMEVGHPRAGRPISRRHVRRTAAAGRDRPGDRRRTADPARRRTDRRPRLRHRRSGPPVAPRPLRPARHRRRPRHPRRPARRLGGSRRLPARWCPGRPGRPAAGGRRPAGNPPMAGPGDRRCESPAVLRSARPAAPR